MRKVEEYQLEKDLDYKYPYKYNPRKGRIVRSTTAVGETQEARRALEVIEADIDLGTETRLVAGIKTLLDIISIILRIRRKRDQEGLSK